MARFFIDRPVFAWVISLLIVLVGILSIRALPVAQYPDIAPPVVNVGASYPGASAKVVEEAVTAIIEREMNGAPGLMYTSSSSDSTGWASINLTFKQGTNPDLAAVEVQNRLKAVEPRLPEAVRRDGVRVEKAADNIQLVVSLKSDGALDDIQLGELAASNVLQALRRVEGVGKVQSFGAEAAMRIWPDPAKLTALSLTPGDIVAALRSHNARVTIGELGNQAVPKDAPLNASIVAGETLQTPEQFANIPLRAQPGGATLRLKDVARVELGGTDYMYLSRVNGMTATGLGIKLAPGSNAVETTRRIRATMQELAQYFPPGVTWDIPYETSTFVEISIRKVLMTLLEAVALVFCVMYLFMQNFRATLIPTLVVPVALLGTLGVMLGLGYSINVLTMFGMVLAIGILVDDAIVVVENVERVMAEEGLDPVAATEKSMGQISGALIGIALVLSAVFLPMGFMPGSTGVIYRQFSVTIITAMVLSLAVALILTPAMCATLLRRGHGAPRFAPARWFNAGFERLTAGYSATVRRSLRRPLLVMLVLAAISYGAFDLFGRLTTTFIPSEDQGVLQSRITLTEGSTAQQTAAVVREIEDYMLTEEKHVVSSVFVAMGFGSSGTAQNQATIYVRLHPFDQRADPSQSARALAQRANRHFSGHRAGRIFFMQPPAIPRLGDTSGFTMYVMDQAGAGIEALTEAAERLEEQAGQDPRVQNPEAQNSEDDAALRIDIDQQKAESFGISVPAVNSMLSTIFAGTEVNDFALGAQLRPVIVQAAAANRMQPEDIDSWYARNAQGEMVPFNAFMTTRWEPVEPRLARIDGVDAIEIEGEPGPGFSSGGAMDAMEELVAALPGNYGMAWTELSYQERQAGNQAPWLFALSALVVFLSLAALYESWSIPFSVMLAVPVGVLGAVVAALAFDQSNDVYFKVGILTTIGLAAKNAILIVEFARDLQQSGRSAVEAAALAARQRLRPILMTSLAFILGVLPLAVARGAGAGAQNSIGIGVMGGMIAATFLGIFMVPAFYVTVRRLTDRRASR